MSNESETIKAFADWIGNFSQLDPSYPAPSMLVLNGMADALEERDALRSEVASLRALLGESRREHVGLCQAAIVDECDCSDCDARREAGCTCGADEWNAKIDETLGLAEEPGFVLTHSNKTI